MFDILEIRTEKSQDLYFLLAQSAAKRAVNLFLIHSSPLEKSMGQRGKTHSGKFLKLITKIKW